MSDFQLEIRVKPRPGLLDPEGKAIHHALNALGWDEVQDVRVGKAIYVELEAPSAVDAMARAEAGGDAARQPRLPGRRRP